VKQELLLQNEYLAAKNRILRAELPSPLRLSDPERACPPQKVRLSLSDLLFQAIFVVQPAENWLRSESISGRNMIPTCR